MISKICDLKIVPNVVKVSMDPFMQMIIDECIEKIHENQ